MIAIRVSKDMRVALVGSPAYFKSHKIPRSPRDLKDTPASRSALAAESIAGNLKRAQDADGQSAGAADL
jgi:hypothetical protein